MTDNMFTNNKKSLKISKITESVNIRRTDNTMDKIKRTNNNLQSNTQTTKDRVTLRHNDNAPEE